MRPILLALLFPILSLGQPHSSKKIEISSFNEEELIESFCDDAGRFYVLGKQTLFLFDGIKAIPLKRLSSDSPSYCAGYIFGEHCFLGLEDGKVLKFSLTFNDVIQTDSLPSALSCILDWNGKLIAGTQRSGIWSFSNGKWIPAASNKDLDDLTINDLVVYRDELVLATDRGLEKLRLPDLSKIGSSELNEALIDPFIISLETNNSDCLWAASYSGYVTGFRGDSSVGSRQMGMQELSGLMCFENELWGLGREGTMYHLALGIDHLSSFRVDDDKIEANHIYFDPEGFIWVCGSSGLYRIDPKYEVVKKDLGDLQLVFGIPNDKFLLANRNSLILLDLRTDSAVGLSEGINAISAHSYRDDLILIGTFNQGLLVLDQLNMELHRIPESELLSRGNILDILVDGNNIWLASLSGVFALELNEDLEIESLNEVPFFTSRENESKHFIYSLHMDQGGSIWAGSDGTGLFKYQDGEFFQVDHPDLNEEHIIGILSTGADNLWLATNQNGLLHYRSGKLSRIGKAEGLRTDLIGTFKEDTLGRIWVFHRQGIDLIHPDKGLVTYVESHDAMQLAPNLQAVFRDQVNNIWLGSEEGLVRISPYMESYRTHPVITFQPPYLFHEDSTFLFKHFQNDMLFHIDAWWMNDPDKLKFRYKLLGLNEDWVTSNDDHLNFFNLASGDYTLIVEAGMNELYYSISSKKLEFTIETPWWRKWWFIGIVLIAISSLFYMIYKFRLNQKTKLERLEKQKILAQYNALRSQMNPHFLFNNFNTLLHLIDIDSARAKKQVEEMSKLFRTSLELRDTDLISLEMELEILGSYIYLQEMRFSNKLRVDIEVETEDRSRLVPPFCLQILVENAIKHNIISTKQPLHIQIRSDLASIEVRNTLQLKTEPEVSSTSFGLESIRQRYMMYSNEGIRISKEDGSFCVKLPLL